MNDGRTNLDSHFLCCCERMALRTFQSNPSLGGFGSESTNTLLTRNGKPLKHDGDAFAQILKELVDNAVDACNVQSSDGEAVQRRVRVDIQRFDTGEGPRDGEDILLVTVTDNGSGMDSIQACVDPFHTSKAHGSTASQPSSNETSSENGRKKSLHEEKQTAGRYGVGLTLCLLHAQRLVPGSCTSIKSATKDQESWSTVICSIDTENDAVDCVESQSVAKRSPTESGTCVSLLVPVRVLCCYEARCLTTCGRVVKVQLLLGHGWQSILLDSSSVSVSHAAWKYSLRHCPKFLSS